MFMTFSPFISGGPLNLYNDQNMCLHFGMTTDGVKDQCIHLEGFANFLGLLESIPFKMLVQIMDQLSTQCLT